MAPDSAKRGALRALSLMMTAVLLGGSTLAPATSGLAGPPLPEHPARDWSQFRPGNADSADDVLAAIHAFDPSLDLSTAKVQQVTFSAPVGGFVLTADLRTGELAIKAFAGSPPAAPGARPGNQPGADHGNSPAGCVLVGPGFGYAGGAPFFPCPNTPLTHTNSVTQVSLTCVLTTYCYTLGQSQVPANAWYYVYCIGPGGAIATGGAQSATCYVVPNSTPAPNTWSTWHAYGGSSGPFAEFYWAH